MVNFSANFQTMMALVVVLPYSQDNHLLRFNRVKFSLAYVVTKTFINMSNDNMQEMLDCVFLLNRPDQPIGFIKKNYSKSNKLQIY